MRSERTSTGLTFGIAQPFVRNHLVDLGSAMDIKSAAQLIGCSAWTVRQILIPRGLPYFRANARGRLIFYRHQVLDWIQSRQEVQEGPSLARRW